MHRTVVIGLALLMASPIGLFGVSFWTANTRAGPSPGVSGPVLLAEAEASLAASVSGKPHWTLANTSGTAPQTEGGVMVYDGVDRYVLYFGGTTKPGTVPVSQTNATWTFSNNTWTLLHPPLSPSARTDASAAYDVHDGYVVLFGGHHQVGNVFGDTWRFKAGLWHHVTSHPHPSARSDAAMTYDAALAKVVLFGGATTTGLANDTWEFQAGHWAWLNLTHSPSARDLAMTTDDPLAGHVLLFGGLGPAPMNDTWEFNGTAWGLLSTTVAPAPRYGGGMAYDRYRASVFLFGGGNLTALYNDTWEFAGGHWTHIALNLTAPTSRIEFGIAYNPSQKSVQVSSGDGCLGSPPYCTDTWYLT
jgi:hypothetical protein